MRKLLASILFIGVFVVAMYFAAWPLPIIPLEWEAPADPGLTGSYAPNEKLARLAYLPVSRHPGPSAVAIDAQGRLYTGTRAGQIYRLPAGGGAAELFADTKGHPLGMAFDQDSNLIVADGHRGLLSVTAEGEVELLTDNAFGRKIGFANDVAVAPDGRIYFTDASKKFEPAKYGGVLAATVYDLLEHGGHGRLVRYDPFIDATEILISDLNFPNGLTLSHDGKSLLISETGSYRVLRYPLEGERRGEYDVILNALPAFPDNITTGADGRYWLALANRRDPLMDRLSNWPRLRKLVRRLPRQFQPRLKPYSHIIAIDIDGQVLANLQDTSAAYSSISSVLEAGDKLYLGSLTDTRLAWLDKAEAGL